MAEKPKTYPQQIQELKAVIAAQEEAIAAANAQPGLIAELEREIANLRGQMEVSAQQDRSLTVTEKAKLNDLTQQAEMAETRVNAAQRANAVLQQNIDALENQLDILGKERDKNSGKDAKIDLLVGQLQNSNLTIANLQQRLRDREHELTTLLEESQKRVQFLTAHNQKLNQFAHEIRSYLASMPDYIRSLKDIAGIE